jgi:hypothetical protein
VFGSVRINRQQREEETDSARSYTQPTQKVWVIVVVKSYHHRLHAIPGLTPH